MKRRICAALIVSGSLVVPSVTAAQVNDDATVNTPRSDVSHPAMVAPPAAGRDWNGHYRTRRVPPFVVAAPPRTPHLWDDAALRGFARSPTPTTSWPSMRNGALIGAAAGALVSVIWASSRNCNTGDVATCGFYYAVGIPAGALVGAFIGWATAK